MTKPDLSTPVARVAEYLRQRSISVANGNIDPDIIAGLWTDNTADFANLSHGDLEWLVNLAIDPVFNATADIPPHVIGFDEGTEQWFGVCSIHGEIIRRPSATAEDHDEVTLALAAHDKAEHGGHGAVHFQDLARLDAQPQFRRNPIRLIEAARACVRELELKVNDPVTSLWLAEQGRELARAVREFDHELATADTQLTPLAEHMRRAAARLADIVARQGDQAPINWAIEHVEPFSDWLVLADEGEAVRTRGTVSDMSPAEMDQIGLLSPQAVASLSSLLAGLADDLDMVVTPQDRWLAVMHWLPQAAALTRALNRSVADWATHPIDHPGGRDE